MRRLLRFLPAVTGSLVLICTQVAQGSAFDPPADGTRPQQAGAGDVSVDAGSGPRGAAKSLVKTELSVEERGEALRFVAEHHPELSHLLMQLQKSRPVEFERAVRELVLQTQAIQRLQEKNPARYQSQLKAWKLDSQIRVLIARWARTADPELEVQIRGLIAERQQLKASQLNADRQKLEEQLKRLEEQLAAFSEAEDVRVTAEWEQLSRRAKAASRSVNAAGRAVKTKPGSAGESSGGQPGADTPSAGGTPRP